MKNTEDELQFGDMIELDFTRDTEKGTVHHHMECKLMPELVPMLLEYNVIEEKEVEDEEETPAERTECPAIERLTKANEDLNFKIRQLASMVQKLEHTVKTLTA